MKFKDWLEEILAQSNLNFDEEFTLSVSGVLYTFTNREVIEKLLEAPKDIQQKMKDDMDNAPRECTLDDALDLCIKASASTSSLLSLLIK